MAGKTLFTVSSGSNKSKIVRSASGPNSGPGPSSRSVPSSAQPTGYYSALSGFASSAYQTAKTTVADDIHYVASTRVGRYVESVYSDARDHVRAAVTYVEGIYNPTPMPESVMHQFGFNPVTTREECPLLQTPTVQQVSSLANLVKGGPGDIFTGAVNLRRYGDGSRHFYIVAAKCGNVNAIARAAGLPPERVSNRLGSMLGMIATWAGCMMAGGASIEPTPDALRDLDNMDAGQPAPSQPVFGKGILTKGRDMVELRNATRASSGGATLHSFLARTLYYHALSGSVLHMQYIADDGDITWFWVGGGGKGFMSKRVNNVLAIQLDIGIWPDMAKSITAFYGDRTMVRKFVQASPQSIKTLIRELIQSTGDKKSFFLKLQQEEQVNNPIPNEVRRSGLEGHPGNGVKGE